MILKKIIRAGLCYLALVFIISGCSGSEKKTEETGDLIEEEKPVSDSPEIAKGGSIVFGWTGTINRKIPVFLNFWYEGNIAIGEIIYQDTKKSAPLYGLLANDGELRLLEFNNSGNISSVIKGIPTDESLYGTWLSTGDRKEFPISVQRREGTKKLNTEKPLPATIPGRYHYTYGSNGASGTIEVYSINQKTIEFSIRTSTGGSSPKIAEIKKASTSVNDNTVVYKMPGPGNCEFTIRFFNGFASVQYSQGNCEMQFGNAATIEGIFAKISQ